MSIWKLGKNGSELLVASTTLTSSPLSVQDERKFPIIEAAIIFAMALTLRLGAIAIPINTDESKWIKRGISFISALLAGDWGDTYASPHPGVPNMWLVGLGMTINSGLSQWFPTLLGLEQPQSITFADVSLFPVQLYLVPRLLQAIVTAIAITGIYLLTWRLLGHAIAVIATTLLLFEPFFLGYQRFITTDALQIDLATLGVLSAILYFYRLLRSQSSVSLTVLSSASDGETAKPTMGQRKWLIGSGVLMGLAIACKLTTVFLLPGLVTWIVGYAYVQRQTSRSQTLSYEIRLAKPKIECLRVSRAKRGTPSNILGVLNQDLVSRVGPQIRWPRIFKDLLLWGTLMIVVVVLIWPAMWTQPGYTGDRLLAGLADESERGYFFFWGELTHNPGLLFYPAVLAFRVSPLLSLGTGIGVLGWGLRAIVHHPSLIQNQQQQPDPHQSVMAALGLTVMGVGLGLSLASTKIDRYLLLVVPLLAMMAAMGWLGLWRAGQLLLLQLEWVPGRSLNPDSQTRLPISSKLLVLGLSACQLTQLWPHFPYCLSYYNPLLGGIQQAQHILMVGQGEGLDQMAQWFNRQTQQETSPQAVSPYDSLPTIASWYRSVFAAYYRGPVQAIPVTDPETDKDFWRGSDRVVFYHNQRQRQLPSTEFLDYFRQQPPLHTITRHGVEYAIAYPGPRVALQDIQQIQHPQAIAFGRRVELMGYDLSPVPETETVVLTLYWHLLKKLPANVGVHLEVSLMAKLKDSLSTDLQPQTTTLATTTTPLFAGLYPSRNLESGDQIRDVHTLPLTVDSQVGLTLSISWRDLDNFDPPRLRFGEAITINIPAIHPN